MADLISKNIQDLRQRKRELIADLTRIERALAALEALDSGTTVHASRQSYGFTCQNVVEGKICGKPFTAKRKDGRFCVACKKWRSSKHGREYLTKHPDGIGIMTAEQRKNKPITLLKGDNLSK